MNRIAVYYEDEWAKIYHADCRDVLPMLSPVDLVLTDPPFSEATHAGARSHDLDGEICTPIQFASCDAAFIRQVFALVEVQRWCLSFIDWRHALELEHEPPPGLEFIRLGIWSKLNPMPQLTGDRPSTGWEAIAILHPPGEKHWNGGGLPALWHHGTSRYGYFGPSNHPTEKPLGLITKLLEQFSNVGDTILDPFMGSGTTLVAAKQLGRKSIGIELEEKYCEIAARRLCQEYLPLKTEPIVKEEQQQLV